MEQNLLENHEQQSVDREAKPAKNRWVYFVWGGVVVLILGILIAGPVAYLTQYTNADRVIPGVYIGDHDVGGLTHDALQDFVESIDTQLVEDGFTFVFEDEEGVTRETEILPLVYTQVLGQSFSYASIQVEDTVDAALAIGRQGNIVARATTALRARLQPQQLDASVVILEEEFEDVLRVGLGTHEVTMQNAGMNFASSTPRITQEQPGEVFDYGAVIAVAESNLKALQLKEITVPRIVILPTITTREVRQLLEELPMVQERAPFALQYSAPEEDPDSLAPTNAKTWAVSFEDIQHMVGFQKTDDGQVHFGVERELFDQWLAPIAEHVDVLPQEAKFALSDGAQKVTQFQPSRNGIAVSSTLVFQAINKHFVALAQDQAEEDKGVELPLYYDVVEPAVKTAEVNELGITEHLSTGISRFVGSSQDRIKNIQNASTKLNGLLIGPGEEFSLVKTIRPITRENGYVPEFIIKGDSIEKGIGGGLCQIGTTSFRMAMNAGMDVTERHNHSLVVSYYNDLSNGNPGTDATIFDPVLDFKFTNDTDNHVLMTTEVDLPNRELRYHLWGTSDGRKGYYSPPVVHKWIPAGEAKVIKTTDREPGTEHCQSAFPGAVTSFTYVVEHPDGEVVEEVYESRYRPLPQLCFIGVTEEELAAEQAGETEPDLLEGFKEE